MKSVALTLFLCLQTASAAELHLRGGAALKEDVSSAGDFDFPPWQQMGVPIPMKVEGMGTYEGKIALSPDGKTFAMGTYLEDARVSHGIAAYGVATYTFVDKLGKWIPLDDHVRVDLPVQGAGGSFDMAMGDRTLTISKVGYNVSGPDEVHTYALYPGRDQNRWYEFMPTLVNDGDNKDQEGFGVSVASAETKSDFFVAVGIAGTSERPPNGRIQVYKAVFPEDYDEEPYWDKVGHNITGNDERFGSTIKLSADGKTLATYDVDAIKGASLMVFQFSEEKKKWVPKGQSIDDAFLCSNFDLSADGSAITSGMRFTSYDDETPQGNVRVWSFNEVSGDWEQRGPDIDSLAPQYMSNAKNTRITFGSILNLSKNGSRLAVTVERVIKSSSMSFNEENHILTFDWIDGEWIQVKKGDIDLQFGMESAAISDDGTVIAAATTDVYLQNVAQAFHFDEENPFKKNLPSVFSRRHSKEVN